MVDRLQLSLVEELQVGDHPYLFHTEDNGLLELDAVSGAVVRFFRQTAPATGDDCLTALSRDHHAPELLEALGELGRAGILRSSAAPLGSIHAPEKPPIAFPLKNLILLVAQDCNMKCTYCYAAGGDFGQPAALMTPETAVRAVDFLLAHSGNQPRIHVSFLGGEPLMNFRTIRAAVEHGRQRQPAGSKPLEFSLTTNGSLLSNPISAWLRDNEVGVSVSLDGPREVQDRHRVFNNGQGSYDIIAPRVKKLLEIHTTRPIAARVTLTRGTDSVLPLFDHLMEMGFYEVGLAPVTSGDQALTYSPAEMARVLGEFQVLADRTVEEAKRGRYVGFSNLSNLVQELHEGAVKKYPCGAGLGLLSCAADGHLYLCHRFGEKKEFRLGHIDGGLDRSGLQEFLQAAHLKNKPHCQSCWIKHVCAGGCYHEANERYGTAFTPNVHYCEYMREWVRIGLRTYIRLAREAPGFLERLTRQRNIT